jgi:hypothetical protein
MLSAGTGNSIGFGVRRCSAAFLRRPLAWSSYGKSAAAAAHFKACGAQENPNNLLPCLKSV